MPSVLLIRLKKSINFLLKCTRCKFDYKFDCHQWDIQLAFSSRTRGFEHACFKDVPLFEDRRNESFLPS